MFSELEIGARYTIEIPSEFLKRNDDEESEKDDKDSKIPKIKSVTKIGTFLNVDSNRNGYFENIEEKQVYENGIVKNHQCGFLAIPLNSTFIAKLTKIDA